MFGEMDALVNGFMETLDNAIEDCRRVTHMAGFDEWSEERKEEAMENLLNDSEHWKRIERILRA